MGMKTRYAAVFPGQGAQFVGMGAELIGESPEAAKIFERASDALGWDLGQLVLEGPEERLNLTEFTQPALLTLSVALWREFRGRYHEPPTFAAGLSLGEYSALVAAEGIALEDAVRLVHLRGRYMQEAVPAGVGGMAAILGLDAATLAEICADVSESDHLATPANLNCPGQVVVSGHLGAVEAVCERARESGARRAVLLPVSAPFHSDLMEPARLRLAEAMESVAFSEAKFPVISNARVRASTDPVEIKSALLEQMISPVRWEESVRWILEAGVRDFLEVGPGKTLTGFLRRIDRDARGIHIGGPAEVRGAWEEL